MSHRASPPSEDGDDHSFPAEEALTRKQAILGEDEPTIERPVPEAIAAAARDDGFRTGRVTFEEILARVGPRHLGGPLPAIRDDLYTTSLEKHDEEPLSTDELDAEWSDEG